MAFDPVWFAVDQIRRVLESMGWTIIAQDTGGDIVKLTVEKSKDKIVTK